MKAQQTKTETKTAVTSTIAQLATQYSAELDTAKAQWSEESIRDAGRNVRTMEGAEGGCRAACCYLLRQGATDQMLQDNPALGRYVLAQFASGYLTDGEYVIFERISGLPKNDKKSDPDYKVWEGDKENKVRGMRARLNDAFQYFRRTLRSVESEIAAGSTFEEASKSRSSSEVRTTEQLLLDQLIKTANKLAALESPTQAQVNLLKLVKETMSAATKLGFSGSGKVTLK